YYITQGLLPSPGQQGPSTRYDDSHLDLLRVIKKLQNAHLPLAEIRARLRSITDDEITKISSSPDFENLPDSAVDYIRRVMGQPTPPPPTPPAAPVPAASMPAPRVSDDFCTFYRSGTKEPEPQRSQWERIPLDPDVELHIRRPLTRQHNKRVERLITIARQLFEED
ncbi:MAG: MerR family transcriptional regulator, partial [Candidatus Limnocylindrales bacterium]